MNRFPFDPYDKSDAEKARAIVCGSSTKYRRGLNGPLEGAQVFLALNAEIGEREDHCCPAEDFSRCQDCDSINAMKYEQAELVKTWAAQWAKEFVKSARRIERCEKDGKG